MVRKSIGIATLAAIASLAVTTARAADFAVPPIVQPQLEYSGWYLRGFVGVGMTHANQLEYIINPLNTNDFVIEHSSISDTTFLGGGFGWEVNQLAALRRYCGISYQGAGRRVRQLHRRRWRSVPRSI